MEAESTAQRRWRVKDVEGRKEGMKERKKRISGCSLNQCDLRQKGKAPCDYFLFGFLETVCIE